MHKRKDMIFFVKENISEFLVNTVLKVKGFYILFHSHGYIGIGPQHCHLWESHPHRGDTACD